MSIKGIIVAGFLGDCLGTPVEWQSREELKLNPVTSLRGWGTYPVPSGTWSDDSSMTWCTAESILEGYNVEKLAFLYLDWYRKAHFTATGVVFDIGISTRRSLECIESKLKHNKTTKLDIQECSCSGEFDNGNGSLMRIGPLIVLLKPLDRVSRFQLVRENSSITHSHVRSVLACFLFCELLIALEQTKDRMRAYELAIEAFNEVLQTETLSVPKSERFVFDRILSREILHAHEDTIRSSGYVIDTLESVLWAFYRGNSLTEVIFTCVNLGTDTDTIGSLGAQLAASYFPEEQIPENLLAQVQRIDDVTAMAEEMERFAVRMGFYSRKHG